MQPGRPQADHAFIRRQVSSLRNGAVSVFARGHYIDDEVRERAPRNEWHWTWATVMAALKYKMNEEKGYAGGFGKHGDQ